MIMETNSEHSNIDDLAFQIISFAGEGKFKVRTAVESYCKGYETQFAALMKEAEEDFLQAHRVQIDFLQSQVVDPNANTPILLVHAMDILMNAMGEQELVQMLIKIIKTKQS